MAGMETVADLSALAYDCRLCPEDAVTADTATTVQQDMATVLADMQEGQSLLLDLSPFARIDSMGLSLLVGLFKDCQDRGVNLTVALGHPIVVKVVISMQLHRHIHFVHVDP